MNECLVNLCVLSPRVEVLKSLKEIPVIPEWTMYYLTIR
jgi:hypothetical protein